ncbi:MAG: SMI1/KNR4 family protein [Lachnospiraceae bacterium]|nr:SMI1/KNR4 family protein [Lachnospiraceae bacterium]
MKWLCCNTITKEIIEKVETDLSIIFPEDFIRIIEKCDRGYPIPNKIEIDGQEEILNNLVSFLEDEESYILRIMRETEFFPSSKLIPVAEDPFGNYYCYLLKDKAFKIVFWNHEDITKLKFVCNSFEELLSMLHE